MALEFMGNFVTVKGIKTNNYHYWIEFNFGK
jgi:hypothetical protein